MPWEEELMSDLLVQALEQMRLKPGQTYRYPVKGGIVELRFLDTLPPEMMPAPLVESDIMLDPWVELPEPEGGVTVIATPGEMPLPDVPDIPTDEE
jgi:hypothetical protein